MKKALIILAATLTAVLNAAPAMAGGIDQLAIFERSVHGGSFDYNTSHKKARRSASHNRSAQRQAAAQRRAASKKAAARRAQAQKLAAQKAAARKVQQKIEIAKAETASDWKAPVKASAIAGTNTLDLRRNDEPAKVEVEEIEIEKAETAELQPETAEVAELECKRYIPSAGMTVTVPCGQ